MVKNLKGFWMNFLGIGISILGLIIAYINEGVKSFLFSAMLIGVFVFVMITIVISFHSEQKSNAERLERLEEKANIQESILSIKSDILYLKKMIEDGKK